MSYDIEETLSRWTEYIDELYEDHTRKNKIDNDVMNNSQLENEPKILMSEMRASLDELAKRKSPGPDNINAELLQNMEGQGKKTLLSLLNKIYASGFIPEDFRRSIYVTIPKKPNATECKDYRTISLMPHVMALLLKIIQRRIRKKLEDEIAEEQFGFISGSGTRDGIFTLQTICERAFEMQRERYLCFIDYEKAFDKVQHEKMIKMLDNQNIGKENIRIIRKLYWTQEAAIKIEDSISNWTTIRRGVRQGCMISPLLFNFYTEHIMRESKLENEGIRIGGRQVNNLRYADDTVILAGNVEELQNMITKVKETSEKYGLRLNAKKTTVMVVKKTA